MGVTIALFVEKRRIRKERVEKKRQSKPEKWDEQFHNTGFYGAFFTGICYNLCERLTNLKNDPDEWKSHTRPLPEDIGDDTFRFMFKRGVLRYEGETDDCVLIKHAEKEVEEGNSIIRVRNGIAYYSDFDFNVHNWCTPDELKDCIHDAFFNKKTNKYIGDYAEWMALHAYMKTLENDGEYEVRAVYALHY